MTTGERLAKLEEKVDGLKDDMRTLTDNLTEITEAVHISRGKKAAYVTIGSIITALLGFAMWLVDHLTSR